jgi:nuclear pore complex protein Nup210
MMLTNGINSLIILGAWTLWIHQNECVLDDAAPNVAGALAVAKDQRRSWSLSGARGLSLLAHIALDG